MIRDLPRRLTIQMNLRNRIKALEQRTRKTQPRIRLVIEAAGRPNLVNAECTRKIGPQGQRIESLKLDGRLDQLEPEEVERFIESFSIEPWTHLR